MKKGLYGNYHKRKIFQVVKTLLFFLAALAVFLLGYFTTGSRKNILTIVAVLGVLPASKEAVAAIMLLRFKPVSEHLYDKIKPFEQVFTCVYDLIFTSSERAMKIDAIVISDNTVIAFVHQKKLPVMDTEKYLKNFLSNHGKGKASIKIFTEERQFLDRLKSLKANEESDSNKHENAKETEQKIKELLFSFSM